MAKEGSLLSIFFRKDVETLRNPTEILKTLSFITLLTIISAPGRAI